MRNPILRLAASFIAGILVLSPWPASPSASSSRQYSQRLSAFQEVQPPQISQPSPSELVIVLDPAHGGTDSGARGENGVVEKDLVLQIARTVRGELESHGYRVAMTRNDDSNPSYDDRAAIANAYRDAIFISLHVSSTGTPGTARSYYGQFGAPIAAPPIGAGAEGNNPGPPAGGLTQWEQAQRPFVETSHRLADLLQIELAQRFASSTDTSTGVPVRGLRSVAAPAVAIEVSSVSITDPNALRAMASPLADAMMQGITAFRSARSIGAK